MIVASVDPGVASGVAVATFPYYPSDEPHAFEADQVETLSYFESLRTLNVLVCESFVPRPGAKTWQPASLELIGALRWMAHKRGIPFVLQSPAAGKKFGTNEKLKKIGWYTVGGAGHINDAKRHLLLYAVTKNLIPIELFT